MATCQVLLQRSEEMEIIWCEIQAVEIVCQNISSKALFQIPYNQGSMRSGVVVQQQDTFREQSRSFPAKCLVKLVQHGTITGSIHGRSTHMGNNQQQTLVVPKDCGHNFLLE
ncbi:hypothetical protein AVEN_169663-1 [Araneus ventricosus]|uniref:Uncharacterized protein n=1 Tax=Araneus ventricosus TaxID=182803 RepID=A0A4Y2D139_ARAVE|nr:hypothetical protein AVEN_169663-1 [Araneus ventricosus]